MSGATRPLRSERLRQTLEDIRDNIGLARGFVTGMDEAGFAADRRTVYAVIRALEIISEATRRLPDELTSRHPAIPWSAIRAAGNVYRHDYEDVLDQRVWATVTRSLPPLETAIRGELARLPPEPA